MSDNASQAIVVALANSGPQACEMFVMLTAPNFNLNPPVTTRSVLAEPKAVTELAWILRPRELGTFDIAVTVGRPSGESRVTASTAMVLGITVTNVLGLRAWQVRLLSALATFLGPMLTAPWWYEQWQKWQKKKRVKEEKDEEKSLRQAAER